MSKKQQKHNWNFQELILHRVHEILLVASPYDAFTLEQDGQLTEQILHEYMGMNLSYAPRVWNAHSAKNAIEMIENRFFDIIIILKNRRCYMPNWCENFVTFSHDDLEKVKEVETRKRFPFHKLTQTRKYSFLLLTRFMYCGLFRMFQGLHTEYAKQGNYHKYDNHNHRCRYLCFQLIINHVRGICAVTCDDTRFGKIIRKLSSAASIW